jgi:phospholipid/cholesterol/gamma-HCH transport system substrate-binding protein
VKVSKEFKIGVVVVCAIAAFIWGINFLRGSNIFVHKYYLYAVYPKIDGLIPANPLLVNGYKVGQINNIELLQRGKRSDVLVKFLLTEDINIPKNSIARSVSADLLGNKAVEIVMGDSRDYVKSGDTLISETEQSFKEAIDKRIAPIQSKAESLISSMDSVINMVSDILNAKNRENLDRSFEGIKKAILTLEKTAYKMDDLVATEKAKISSILTHLNNITTNLDKNGARIDNILLNMSNVSDSLAKSNLKSAIAEADKSLKELNTLLAGINAGQGTLGKMAKNDSLYTNLNKSSADLDRLLKDLRLNPERYIHFSVFGRKKKPITE